MLSWHCSTQCIYNSLAERQQINTVKVPAKPSFDFFKAQNLKIFSQWFQKVLKIPKRQRKISENYWNQLILEEGSIKIDNNQSRILILLIFIKSKNQSSNFSIRSQFHQTEIKVTMEGLQFTSRFHSQVDLPRYALKVAKSIWFLCD